MNEESLKLMVEKLVREMAGGGDTLHAVPKGEVHGYERQEGKQGCGESEGCIPDITAIDLREQYLVKDPKNGAAFLELKRRTPARIGVGRAGARYKTVTMLRVRADHAAAQDSVFSLVPQDYPGKHGYVPVKTLCENKDEYLTRPDKGRRFDGGDQEVIRKTLGQGPRVVIAVGDGLSSMAIEANAAPCVEAIRAGLKRHGIEVGPVPFIKFCRVGAGDHIGELTGAEVICLLVGERPGLVTAESMSAYITYMPRLGVSESKRTVVSNIHKGGTPATEAGAQIAGVIKTILEQKASGVDLVRS